MNLSREFWLQRQPRIEVWADFVDLAIHEFVDRLGSPKLLGITTGSWRAALRDKYPINTPPRMYRR